MTPPDLHEARRLWESYLRQGTDAEGLRKLLAWFPRLLAECEEGRTSLFGPRGEEPACPAGATT